MRAVVQRVKKASVTVGGETVGAIGNGLLVLLGIEPADGDADIDYIVKKCTRLRIFEDSEGKMNVSALDLGYSVLLVSQFTLHGDARKGNRPSFSAAAQPEIAIPLYEKTVRAFRGLIPTETGVFGAEMQVELVNDGPVTILLDSKRLF
ncbi:MAG: D-tyrosyl-tRNA(Tyr) deacylase [Clostridia bacterium]|nr:D-tyrosyl-tRNA(Tyr) deacylase [Clostridia bacterium]